MGRPKYYVLSSLKTDSWNSLHLHDKYHKRKSQIKINNGCRKKNNVDLLSEGPHGISSIKKLKINLRKKFKCPPLGLLFIQLEVVRIKCINVKFTVSTS